MGRFSSRKTSTSKKVSKDSDKETSVIMWLGEAQKDSEQRKHYTSFCSGDTKINAHSFVYIKSPGNKKDSIAYVQDLYENKEEEKRVSLRWFNFPEETTLKKSEAHSKEVLITATVEDKGVECINGVATVLTLNHYEEWLKILPEDRCLENFVCFLCHREDRGSGIGEFALDELQGYDTQTVVDMIRKKQETGEKEEGSGSCKPADKVYERTTRSPESSTEAVDPKSDVSEPVPHMLFKVKDEVELLNQDKGRRGCWFKYRVLESSPKLLKVVLSVDGPGNLEISVPCQKEAYPDKLGMRCPGRLTVRPFPSEDLSNPRLETGVAVDAWMDDGWWEGVILGFTSSTRTDKVQVYCPGEDKFVTVEVKNIRISRDWVSGKWTDIKPKANLSSCLTSLCNPSFPMAPPRTNVNKRAEDAKRKLTTSLCNPSFPMAPPRTNVNKPAEDAKRKLTTSLCNPSFPMAPPRTDVNKQAEDAKRKLTNPSEAVEPILHFKKRFCVRYKQDSGASGSGEKTNEQ